MVELAKRPRYAQFEAIARRDNLRRGGRATDEQEELSEMIRTARDSGWRENMERGADAMDKFMSGAPSPAAERARKKLY